MVGNLSNIYFLALYLLIYFLLYFIRLHFRICNIYRFTIRIYSTETNGNEGTKYKKYAEYEKNINSFVIFFQ